MSEPNFQVRSLLSCCCPCCRPCPCCCRRPLALGLWSLRLTSSSPQMLWHEKLPQITDGPACSGCTISVIVGA